MSSASDALAKTVVEAAYDEVSPVYAGDREEPLTDSTFPFLPLLMDHKAAGEAFVSFGSPVLGAPSRFRWVISIDAADGLADVAERQSAVLGAMVASFLLALLIGILVYRGYVVPNDQIAEHLSELQMGRGDLEMPETSVSHPFRRLVRLINMTVQRIPNRGMAIPTADLSSIGRSIPDDGSLGDLSLPGLSAPTSPPPALPLPSVSPPPSRNNRNHRGSEAPDALIFENLSMDSLPPSPVPPSEPMYASNGGMSFESSEETEAALLPPSSEFEPGDLSNLGIPSTPGAEEAIAEAIAQLEGARRAKTRPWRPPAASRRPRFGAVRWVPATGPAPSKKSASRRPDPRYPRPRVFAAGAA